MTSTALLPVVLTLFSKVKERKKKVQRRSCLKGLRRLLVLTENLLSDFKSRGHPNWG